MPKKGENIYKRKDGRWEGRYIFARTTSGKAMYKSIYGHSYLEVKKRLNEIKFLSQQNLCINFSKIDTVILSTVSYEWLGFIQAQIKESSYIKYINIVENYIIIHMGSLHLHKITTEYIELFKFKLLKSGGKKNVPLSLKTVADIISILKRILQYAKKKYNILTCDLTNLKIRLSPKPIQVLSTQEQQRLINYLLAHQNRINIGILLALFTGIRIGELCALRQHDLIVAESMLVISQTMQRIQAKDTALLPKTKIIITSPKSISSIRKIPIPEPLLPIIAKIADDDQGFLLTGIHNKFIEPRTLQNHFHKILNQVQIAPTNFHTLRHTFATQCVTLGMDIKSLSEILGHANVNITLNKYVHPSFATKQHNMNKLGILLTVK